MADSSDIDQELHKRDHGIFKTKPTRLRTTDLLSHDILAPGTIAAGYNSTKVQYRVRIWVLGLGLGLGTDFG